MEAELAAAMGGMSDKEIYGDLSRREKKPAPGAEGGRKKGKVLAVHGGDPAPEEGKVVGHGLQQAAALSAIAALTTALDEKARQAVEHVVAPLLKEHPMKAVGAKAAGARLEAMGIHLTEHPGDIDRNHPIVVRREDPCTFRTVTCEHQSRLRMAVCDCAERVN